MQSAPQPGSWGQGGGAAERGGREGREGRDGRDGLSSWWKNFKQKTQRREDESRDRGTMGAQGGSSSTDVASGEPQGIFGVPLQVSVRYANVAISLSDGNGQSYIYGYVPIVVAKCGVFLKEKGKQSGPLVTIC
jgi:hypothetical protein